MQMPTIHEREHEVTEASETEEQTPPPGRAGSPTPSLGPCEHCGEEYCTDADIETARLARKSKASQVTISASIHSTPVKPLRKKRRLDSLASVAKEQAGRFVISTNRENALFNGKVIPSVYPMSPFTDGFMAATSDDLFAEAVQEHGVQEPKQERPMKLQLQIPASPHIVPESTSPSRSDSLADQSTSPSTASIGTRSPERRKLDELHKGVKIVYKRASHSKSSNRLSTLLRRS